MIKNINDKRLESIIKRILIVDPPDKIIIYGSRSRNENVSTSDFDIALFGKVNLAKIKDNLEEAETLLKIDLVAFDEIKDEKFKNKILKEGIIIYER